MHKTIMAAGHASLDITPVFSQKGARLADLLQPGKLVQVGRAAIHSGGSVSNTGLALKAIGADVRLAAKVGRDAFGRMLEAVYAQHGCGGSLIVDETMETAYTVVVAVPGSDRLFLHDPGANDTFRASDVTDAMLDGVSHFHFGYPPLVRSMYENHGRELTALFRRVKARGITTSLDMVMVDPSGPAAGADWPGILRDTLPYVDFFLPSIEEMCFYLDRERYREWNRRGGDITETLDAENDIRPIADAIMGLGACVLLLKCGAPGIHYRSVNDEDGRLSSLCAQAGLDLSAWRGLEGFEAGFLQEDVKSATGAGDAAIAAFLMAMLSGHGLIRCVQLAAAEGARCVSTYDTLSGLLPLETLEGMIDAGWPRVQRRFG